MLIVYLLAIFIPGLVRLGVVASLIISFFIVEYFIRNKLSVGRGFDILILSYVLLNFVSLIWFFLSGLPISVYIQEFSNSILPVFFYFFAKNKDENNLDFYRNTLMALVLFFVIGFVFFFLQPYNYRYFLSTIDGVGTNPISTSEFYRSILGITATGSLGAIGVLISFSKIIDTEGHKGKISFIICLIAVILTFRRSALFVTLAAIIALHYLAYFKFNLLKKRYLILEITLLTGTIIFLLKKNPEFLPDLGDRLKMIFDAFGERSKSWSDGLKHGNLIIGSGLGVFSHKAVPYSDKFIPDGNYVRMLAEIGVLGIFIFISIIISTIIKGIKSLSEYYLEVGIIIAICLQALGSDIFSFQIVIPIFWYSIGRIHQNTLKEKAI